MFNNKAIVLGIFLGTVDAVQYRPYVNGRTPWYKDLPKAPEPNFKIDYFVPNFGMDHEIKMNQKNLKDSEEQYGHKFSASFKAPKGHPVDYKVPNFGLDKEIVMNQQNLKDSEAQYNHKFSASFKAPKGHPVDYKVPNFGLDHDIIMNQKNLKDSEAQYKTKFSASFKAPKGHPVDYFVPNFGLDKDIKVSLANTAETEKDLKTQFNPPALVATEEELNVDSDPICSSAGCDQYKHKKAKLGYPINYPVPNLGQDKDMTSTMENEKLASSMVNHNWEFGTDESKAKWHNKAKDADYNFAPELDHDMVTTEKNLNNAQTTLKHKWVIQDLQTENEVNVESDPICSSAGCDQYKHKKAKLGYPINYPVPNNGVDPDMLGTLESEKLASAMVNHNWEFGTEESKAKWHNKAKDTDYNFAPELDHDMVTTEKNLNNAQDKLKHKWVIQDLQTENEINLESDPICSSAGCDQYKHKKPKLGYPINYPVPNNGVDPDMITTLESEKLASAMVNHNWEFGTEESKAKWHNKAKDTDYNFAPELDHDMITTEKNLNNAQTTLKHKWVIKDD